MDKQQLLDIANPTPMEWVTQQLVQGNSKTSAEAVRRVLSKMDKQLYKTIAKELTFQQVRHCLEAAVELLSGNEVNENTLALEP